MTIKDSLVGKRVSEVSISPEGDYLQFTTDKGPVYWRADGDCCSQSYFHETEGLWALTYQNPVLDVVEVEMPRLTSLPGTLQDVDKIYCVKITTQSGTTLVIFRNSSNGYYGGSLDVVDGTPPKGMTFKAIGSIRDLINFVPKHGDEE